MTSFHIAPENTQVGTRHSRGFGRGINLQVFAQSTQESQNSQQVRAALLRTLRAVDVELLQLATYRRLQPISVIWSEFDGPPNFLDCPARPMFYESACRVMTLGRPERWSTASTGIFALPGNGAWISTLRRSGICAGVTIAIHLANDRRYVFDLGAKSEPCFESDSEEISALSATAFIVTQRLASWDCDAASSTEAESSLSVRELEVLRWCKDGKSYPEIAQILGISAKTVEFHIANAMRKLGVNQKISAIVAAARQGLIEL